ncbi:MAG: hypothetical protein DDT20_01813 [Firmicutes bacterium]|nr:hypothetical protein [Bacillota bacterium]
MLGKDTNRRSIRLPAYDYAQPSAYFVTICTHDKDNVFGEVADGKVRLSEWGDIATRCWADIPDHFPCVLLDEYVVMPNTTANSYISSLTTS